ncbi:MAG: DUF3833 domain-containing protein [Alteromonadaceae bacterium]
MNKIINIIFTLFTLLILASCSVDLADYQKEKKPFDIKSYFSGDIVAWGMIQDYSNKVNRRFCVEIKGTWEANEGTLAEKFYFNDGEISYRNWQLTKKANGTYLGTAEDVVGTAIGKHQGFAFQFTYDLLLKIDDETYQVSMDDWMYQIDDYRVMNKTTISKLGIDVAEVTLFFDKETPNQTCSSFNNS